MGSTSSHLRAVPRWVRPPGGVSFNSSDSDPIWSSYLSAGTSRRIGAPFGSRALDRAVERCVDRGVIVLAAAGLARTGILDETPHVVLPPEICLPAVGQGALAIEGPLSDEGLRARLQAIEDPTARIQVTAERAMLQKLEGNCHSSIAGHASASAGRLKLEAMVASYDGDRMLSAASDTYLDLDAADVFSRAHELGEEVAAHLLSQGARDLIRQAEVEAMRSQLTSN